MKFRKLNSNPYAGNAIIGIVLFVIVIPSVLYLGAFLLGSPSAAQPIVQLSLALGVSASVLAIALLIIELFQDRQLDRNYRRNRATKLPLADGRYECQYCGSQQVRADDHYCRVCGKALKY